MAKSKMVAEILDLHAFREVMEWVANEEAEAGDRDGVHLWLEYAFDAQMNQYVWHLRVVVGPLDEEDERHKEWRGGGVTLAEALRAATGTTFA